MQALKARMAGGEELLDSLGKAETAFHIHDFYLARDVRIEWQRVGVVQERIL